MILNSSVDRFELSHMPFLARRFSLITFHHILKPLQSRLHNCKGTFLRYNFMEGNNHSIKLCLDLYLHTRTLCIVQLRSLEL